MSRSVWVGQGQSKFLIFDHWENFDYFGEDYTELEPAQSKSLAQTLFELRLELAEEGQSQRNQAVIELAIRLIGEDIAALPSASVSVKEKSRELRAVAEPQALQRFKPRASLTAARIAPQYSDARWFELLKRLRLSHSSQFARFLLDRNACGRKGGEIVTNATNRKLNDCLISLGLAFAPRAPAATQTRFALAISTARAPVLYDPHRSSRSSPSDRMSEIRFLSFPNPNRSGHKRVPRPNQSART